MCGTLSKHYAFWANRLAELAKGFFCVGKIPKTPRKILEIAQIAVLMLVKSSGLHVSHHTSVLSEIQALVLPSSAQQLTAVKLEARCSQTACASLWFYAAAINVRNCQWCLRYGLYFTALQTGVSAAQAAITRPTVTHLTPVGLETPPHYTSCTFKVPRASAGALCAKEKPFVSFSRNHFVSRDNSLPPLANTFCVKEFSKTALVKIVTCKIFLWPTVVRA